MEKKVYINPQVLVFAIRPVNMIADSFDKGEGDFDPEEMTFARENNTDEENTVETGNNRNSVWDNIW
ncbi:MAG: hypothetical protein J6P67_07500 [Bacteroidaceae bacterium]|nr:hypothetical protein [Bacteroidaceae bacterium]